MKQVTQNRRVIRVSPAAHLAAKVAAAAEDKTLEQLASEVLQEALERRRKLAADDTLRAAMATTPTVATRG